MRRKQGTLVPLEAAVLAVAVDLQRSGVREFHGYQLAKHLSHVSDKRLLTAYGTLYRALGRLEKMGLLESHAEDPQVAADENRPMRRLYALTGEGVAAVRRESSAAHGRKPRRRVAPA
jgi:PadR family transcriptional regulator PadR